MITLEVVLGSRTNGQVESLARASNVSDPEQAPVTNNVGFNERTPGVCLECINHEEECRPWHLALTSLTTWKSRVARLGSWGLLARSLPVVLTTAWQLVSSESNLLCSRTERPFRVARSTGVEMRRLLANSTTASLNRDQRSNTRKGLASWREMSSWTNILTLDIVICPELICLLVLLLIKAMTEAIWGSGLSMNG